MTVAIFSRRLDELEEGSAIQDTLEKMTGQRSVPNIFISAFLSNFADRLPWLTLVFFHI